MITGPFPIGIYDALSPPFHKDMGGFGSPKLKDIVVVKVIGYVIVPMMTITNLIQTLVSRIDG